MDDPQDTINAGAEAPGSASRLEVTPEEEPQRLGDADSDQPQVPTSGCTKQDLLQKYKSLEDKIALLRVNIDRVRCQSQDLEKRYLENIETVKAKSDDLQRTIRVHEKTQRETTFQRNEQLNDLRAEITMLTSELEKLKQGKARLDLAPSHPYESQTPGRDLELGLRRTREEYSSSQAKTDADTGHPKDNSERVSQELSKIKICSLENQDNS